MGIKCPKCNTDNPDTLKFCGECGTQIIPLEEAPVTETLETPKEELTTGSTFAGRYQIIEELGKGGMGNVYKAIDKEINTKVALKLIKPEVAADKKTIERFRNELKMARDISHKNVCRMYDLNKEEGNYYITMEYVPGEDLKGMIRMMGQLGAGKSISIAKQVCEGLAEAHRLGVVHRDLKPSNIMIDKEGNVRIMDFGIATSLTAKGITGAGVMIGTPEYMSPEQAEVKEIDQRSDIYSLGVILYEMVTGRVPFEGETPLGIAMRHKGEIPKDPREINAQIPEDISRVILRCMEKDKEKRYQSAGELRSELIRIEEGIPTTERVEPKRKPITSKEITVTFGLKKLFIPAFIVLAILIVAVVIWQLLPQKEAVPAAIARNSIAVLPFADLSPKKDLEYLCDGMTDEIIAKLSRLRGWKVMNRTSVMQYKNIDKDIKEIGEELDVANILLGSVRKEEDNIRVTAQLVNAEDRFQIWIDVYDRKLESVFIIQSDIAEKISKALQTELSLEEKEHLQKHPTENLKAYRLYIQGRWYLEKRTETSLRKAIEYFNRAIEEDQSYGLAYAELASAYSLLAEYSPYPPQEAYLKAKEAVRKALEIDESLAEAHAELAMLKSSYEWDWEGAEKELKRAIELNPNYATAHHWYAIKLARRLRFNEAMEEIKRARELDPLSLVISRNVGAILFFAREYDQAEEALQKTIEMDPDFSMLHYYIGCVYSQKAMYNKALEEFQKQKELASAFSSYIEAAIGVVYARMGEIVKAKQVLNDLIEQSKHLYVSPYALAWLYFALGKKDQGFAELEKAYKIHDSWLDEIKVEPFLDTARSDPRFAALLKKMNFEQ
jgi:serine/threonine-protein kinase